MEIKNIYFYRLMCTNSLSSWTQRWYSPGPRSQDFATPDEQARCCRSSRQGGKQGKAHRVGSPGVEGRSEAKSWFEGSRWHGKGRKAVRSPSWLTSRPLCLRAHFCSGHRGPHCLFQTPPRQGHPGAQEGAQAIPSRWRSEQRGASPPPLERLRWP